ncbi:MAG: response regulator [Elusimicrobia bacterium]|nr:response regulator [Elusimicrobiota bacterium]
MKILIADDEPGILDALKFVLTGERHEVVLAHDGDEALQAFQQHQDLDLIILDINMPALSGLEVLNRIRKTDKEIKIILLTVRDGLADQVSGYDAQADYYLTKPFDHDILLAYIRACAKKKR